MKIKTKNILTIDELSSKEFLELIDFSIKLKSKKKKTKGKLLLENKTLAMIFEKPSTRTRVSFEVGIKKYNFGKYPSVINETPVVHEIFLCARFLKNCNMEIDWTLSDWWNKCREIFCVVDPSTIDLFWFKFHWKFEQRFITNYTSNFTQSLQFSDWLNLYSNQNYKFDENKKEKWRSENGLFVQ